MFFRKRESLIAIDIGADSLSLLKISNPKTKPVITHYCRTNIAQSGGASSYGITDPESLSKKISGLMDLADIKQGAVVTAIPGPSVFTKKIKMPCMNREELRANIKFEAANVVPDNIDAVRLDYQVLRSAGKNQYEVLIVAVKKEIVDSFSSCLKSTGLTPEIIDVDFFALQNIFEFSYPEYLNETVALLNIGARYASVCICRNGESILTGDLQYGGRSMTEALALQLGIEFAQAEDIKKNEASWSDERVKAAIEKSAAEAAYEFNRRLTFLWNASGAEGGIERILVSGGGSRMPYLCEKLQHQTGLACERLDPLRLIDVAKGLDRDEIMKSKAEIAVAVGLAMRTRADRILPP